MSNKPNVHARPAGRTGRVNPNDPNRKPLIYVGIVVALVVVLGMTLAIIRSTSDSEAAGGLVYGTVERIGDPLPTLPEDGSADPAVGLAAPKLVGQTLAEDPITVGGPGVEPSLIVFLAHWCPHCRKEVPVLVDMTEQGALDGVRLVAVATGTNEEAVNFPPSAWLDDEGWPGEVLVDDQEGTGAASYGLSGYPLLVMVDADGKVTARTSGEKSAAEIEALVATATAGS